MSKSKQQTKSKSKGSRLTVKMLENLHEEMKMVAKEEFDDLFNRLDFGDQLIIMNYLNTHVKKEE